MIEFHQILSLVFLLFIIATWGIVALPPSVITILISLELLLLSVSLSFVIFSLYLGDISGQIFALMILLLLVLTLHRLALLYHTTVYGVIFYLTRYHHSKAKHTYNGTSNSNLSTPSFFLSNP
jgi:NADH:ubiquinone oxidoreductase subunit K